MPLATLECVRVAINLELGKFLYLNKNRLETIRVPLFESTNKPVEYVKPEKPKKGFWTGLLGL